MADGSGGTVWEYDVQGHVVKETKVVNDSPTNHNFVTQWGYTKEGLLSWMQYPGGNGGQAGEKRPDDSVYVLRYGPKLPILFPCLLSPEFWLRF